MKVAIVGAGFVADYYLATAALHPSLEVVGITDLIPERSALLAGNYGIARFASLDEMLETCRFDLLLNLTNPVAHYAVSRRALEAGKHVYSEKPLAMDMAQARELVTLAEQRGLQICSAPCSLLSESAQAVWLALRRQVIGPVRLVYAEMDDGPVHRMPYRQWLSKSGIPWPYKDEFEVGCTLEHAGYCVSWLAAWFGPARSVTSFASVQIPDKVPGEVLGVHSPDFSVAMIEFHSGVVARVTCSIVGTHDHQMRLFGDDGVLSVHDTWDYRTPVSVRHWARIRRRMFLSPLRRRLPLPASPVGKIRTRGAQTMDFARGPAEMAAALAEGRRSRLPMDFSLHVTEMALAIHEADRYPGRREMHSTFEALEPWAEA